MNYALYDTVHQIGKKRKKQKAIGIDTAEICYT